MLEALEALENECEKYRYWLILCGGGQLNIKKNNQIEKFVLISMLTMM